MHVSQLKQMANLLAITKDVTARNLMHSKDLMSIKDKIDDRIRSHESPR